MGLTNRQRVIMSPESRTASGLIPEQQMLEGTGLIVFIKMLVVSGSASITFVIEEQDPASKEWTALLTSAAITSVSLVRLIVARGIAAVSNVAANNAIAGRYRVRPVHGTADACTYSVAAIEMVQ